MPRRRSRRATRIAAQGLELGLAVPEVVARRLLRMAVAGSAASGADREELLRMSAEKVAAFYESWNAMLVAAWAANMRLLLSASIWSAPWVAAHRRAARAHVRRTGLDILEAGIGPVHRRVVANAKRLRSVR